MREMNIPKARKLLLKIARECRDEVSAENIRDVVGDYMHKREPMKPVARNKQAKITSDLVLSVLAAQRENPRLHNRDIGRHFGIDGGRVSEIIQGDRTFTYPEGTPAFRERYK